MVGLVAPTGTPEDPEPVIRRLHAETAAALGAPDVREGLARQGAESATSTPEEFRQLTAADIARWSGV
ncbi:MAG: tripartite tricarboxylate transporter substrate binding protein, partial [Acetobacteraceae bacterium]|nr:tripartite tricarboxylate transporter substrate binding protein [Acetobacteraceae bacterium]